MPWRSIRITPMKCLSVADSSSMAIHWRTQGEASRRLYCAAGCGPGHDQRIGRHLFGSDRMNPFTTLPKLIKSKGPVEQIETLSEGLTMKNWKTSLAGIASCLVALGLIWAPPEYQPKIQATAAALAGRARCVRANHFFVIFLAQPFAGFRLVWASTPSPNGLRPSFLSPPLGDRAEARKHKSRKDLNATKNAMFRRLTQESFIDHASHAKPGIWRLPTASIPGVHQHSTLSLPLRALPGV